MMIAWLKLLAITYSLLLRGYFGLLVGLRVAVVTRLALTGHSGRFPEDIETEASDKYKEVRHTSDLHECFALGCALAMLPLQIT